MNMSIKAKLTASENKTIDLLAKINLTVANADEHDAYSHLHWLFFSSIVHVLSVEELNTVTKFINGKGSLD
jgi:hypothetical protein